MEFTSKQSIGISAALFTLMVSSAAILSSKERKVSPNFCYSVYHIEQTLDLGVFLGDIQDAQQIKIQNNLHVKEVLPLVSSESNELLPVKVSSNLAQYVMQIEPIASRINGITQERGDRYQHPFLVTVDKDTGHLIDLQSATKNESVLKEYMSIFDFFQLSAQQGNYQYLNGNGRYTANMAYSVDNPRKFYKSNLGYTHTEHNISLHNNEQVIIMSDTECFYQSSTAQESYTINMSPKAYMQGEGQVTINAQPQSQWSPSHQFHELRANITRWPGYKINKPITQALAFSKIKKMLITLQAKPLETKQALSIITKSTPSWPFFGRYLMQNIVPEALTGKVILGLQKINTQASISALISIIASPVQSETKQASIQALARTSARVSHKDLIKLQQLVSKSSDKIELLDNDVLLINTLGMMVNRRILMPPDNIKQLQKFLLTQLESATGKDKIPYVQAISHYLTEFDHHEKSLLLAQLNNNLDPLRLAITQALKKIPYDESFTKPALSQLKKEPQANIRAALIQLLEHSTSQSLAVKQHLISILSISTNSHEREQVLHNLYNAYDSFTPQEVAILKHVLTREYVPTNQRLLATILLKHNDKDAYQED
ncbi:hypothetical protein [Paraglaciecola sp.]|uniref:hypothetical protein n=1 Tax=Paraglaciecola sp. TaxID=1920173 RepID=UPI003263B6D1